MYTKGTRDILILVCFYLKIKSCFQDQKKGSHAKLLFSFSNNYEDVEILGGTRTTPALPPFLPPFLSLSSSFPSFISHCPGKTPVW